MITDEEYVTRKATAMGALEHDVSVTHLDDGGARIRLERTLPAMVPDFVRPMVGETIEVVQTEDWGPAQPDGRRTGRMTATISGTPVTLSGELVLEPNDGSSIHRLVADVKAKVPFIGAKIEKGIGEVILLAARKEEQVGSAWLAEHA
jgi:hypothetical protein